MKAVPTTDIKQFDTLASVSPEPHTVQAQTTAGLTVIVPAGTVPGEFVELNDDGTAPTGIANVVDAASFNANYTPVA